MLKKIQEFFQSLLKTGKSGITKTDQAAETIEDLAEVYGKYDPTTPPGQFKEQKPIIDQEGNIKTRVASYTPEGFTETQKRTGVGSFSDESLREQYFDEGFDATESLEEFIIRKRGITPEARATELREKGRIKSLEQVDDTMVEKKIEPETIQLINNLGKSTGREPKDIRQLIVDKMNDGYSPGDPKRVTIDDDARINAYLESQVLMDPGFVDDLVEETMELPRSKKPTGDPILDDLIAQEAELVKKGAKQSEELKTIRENSLEVKRMLDDMGLDTSDIDFDIIKNSDDLDAVRREAMKVERLMSGMMGGGMDDLVRGGNLEKAMESISGQARSDMALAKEMAEMARTPGELETAIKRMEEIQKAYEESVRTGVYESPFSPARILNAKGGRIGFDEGGGPKMSRRGFLGMMGAGIASLFVPKGAQRVAEIATAGATKVPLTAEGMPIWFPSLVNKIRKEGKLRKATYADAKGGEPIDVYTFEDPSLSGKKLFMEENIQTGAITISGRGDDMQIAELTFRPGEESIMVSPKGSKTSKAPNVFEAEEFMKGPGEGIGDFENFGGMEDLRFGLDTWENLVKSPKQKLEEIAEKFKTTQRNPTPDVDVEEFAKGGRVGYKSGGGVETLFRRKAS
tara:strand:+ start:41 stop:1930 length:1890 start_codon:yes stop_codon:yes gene_type:complete